MDKPSRSIIKSISYRIVGTLLTFITSWVLTGNLFVSVTIGVVDTIVKLVAFFLHERAWEYIKYGRQCEKESHDD